MEYLTENSLITYPFKDGMTLKDLSSPYVVPPDCILDLQIVSKDADAVKAAMTALSKATGNISLEVTLYDSSDSVIDSSIMSWAIGSIVERTTLTYSDSLLTAKLVPGPSLVTLAAGADFSYTFSLAVAEICSSALLQRTPQVPQIEFFNTSETTGLPVSEHAFTSAFNVGPRANITIAEVAPNIQIGVEAGEGTGLYDGCSTAPGQIKTINYIASNQGHFLLQGDGCYNVVNLSNGLLFENTCVPKCTPENLVNFAHYQNRLHNGLNTIVDYADTLYGSIKTDMDDYLAVQVPLKSRSTFDAIFVKTQDSRYTYYSFTVGMYNPSKVDRAVTMTISPYGAALVPGTVKFKVNDTTVFYNSITSQTFTIPCLNYGTLVFVLKMSKSDVARLDIISTFYPNTKTYILIGGETEPLVSPTFGLAWISTTIDGSYTTFYPRFTGVMYNPTGGAFAGATTGVLTNASVYSGTMNVSAVIPAGDTEPIDFTLAVAADTPGQLAYTANMTPFAKAITLTPPSITVDLESAKGAIVGSDTRFYASGNLINPFDQTLSVTISAVLTSATLDGTFRIVVDGVAYTYGSISATVSLPANSISPMDFKLLVLTGSTGGAAVSFDYSSVLDPLVKSLTLQA